MKRSHTFILTIFFAVGLASCSGDAGKAVGQVNVSVMFMNNYAAVDDDATMVMVYAWDRAGWNNGNPGTPASASNDGMFMDIMLSSSAGDILPNKTHNLALKALPEGDYYIGVFESSHMNYSTETATLIGYYNANNANTMKTMQASEATPVSVSSAKPVELKTMMVMPKLEM